ncbi:MAG: aminotransferase class V-fold PLP-dependent enzyme [Acidobacteriota bacterium]|nr:aminotransferase class V-fold PLP-dependent enzyme [Acidobacteriota bacterium]
MNEPAQQQHASTDTRAEQSADTRAQQPDATRAPSRVERLAAEHERLGRAATEFVASYARSLEGATVCSRATPAEIERLFDEPLPREGVPVEELFARFTSEVVQNSMAIPSPRYYGLFNPTPVAVGVWADALASAINQNQAVWRNSPAASVLEARVLRWLCEMVGYGPAAYGTMTSGGSEANLVALKCARDRAARSARDLGLRHSEGEREGGDLVVYASEQAHYSFEKSVDILGLGRRGLRKVATDERFHVRVDLLREEIERDIEKGNVPVCVAGAAGATSTGVVDPLDELADLARQYDIWFHVDAAYGGALAMSEKHRHKLKGIERADSVTVDPHKWMFVPFAAGATLVRDGGRVLRDSFDITPEYLSEQRGGEDVPFDCFRYGQLGTKRFNSLKVWMALKSLGTRGYAEIVDRQIELTEYLAARLRETENFETVGEVETAVCCFRFVPYWVRGAGDAERDAVQQALQQRVERSGEAWISTTILKGRRALRANVNSFLTERRHVDDLLELLKRESLELTRAR